MKSWRIGAVLCLAICGCAPSGSPPKLKTLPVKGAVFLDDKPLAGANVVFMAGTPPKALAGTTKEDGTYELQTLEGREGSLQGDYKVTISRMVKPDGSPLAPGELQAMVGGIEQLPARYSRFDATELSQTVSPEGGTYDFKLSSK